MSDIRAFSRTALDRLAREPRLTLDARVVFAVLARADEDGIAELEIDELLNAVAPYGGGSGGLEHDGVALAVKRLSAINGRRRGPFKTGATTRRIELREPFLPVEDVLSLKHQEVDE